MNRNAEYMELMSELDALDAPGGVVERAMRRDRRRKRVMRPLTTLAAAFALFVVLVNFSAPVAYACSRVPGLRELAEAVTFSRSLGDAVANEYVQPIWLEQTENDITVTVEYLIVDQKTVNIFYRLASERYPRLEATPRFFTADGSFLESVAYGPNDWDVPNGELRSMTVDFHSGSVPPALRMRLSMRDMDAGIGREAVNSIWDDLVEPAPEDYVAEFEFLLEFDPYFTRQGKHFATNQSVVLDGQTLHITNVDVYPSYLSLTVTGDGDNTAWLKSLKFYLVTDRGVRFDTTSDGTISLWDPNRPDTIFFRADSTFFYGASSITLYLTSAEWLDKDAGMVHVDLKRGRADAMPEGFSFVGAEREGKSWVPTVLKPKNTAQTFAGDYYDAEGNRYELHAWSHVQTYGEETAPEGYVYEQSILYDYPYDEVWLTPRFTRAWSAETPVAVTIGLK